MKSVLLTGATGFLGLRLENYLKSNHFNVTSLSRSSKSNVVCDISKFKPIFIKGFDTVIHAAGKAHSIPKNEIEEQEFYNVNVKGTDNLLRGLEKASLPKEFVFISSVSVYGLVSGKLINEEAPLLAKDPYGLSKIAAEQLVLDWCSQNKVICTILRLPLLVGKKAPGNLGAMVKAINRGYYFNIAGGVAKKSMVIAKDVAKFTAVVAPFGGVYNLTDGVHPSFKSLSAVIATSKNKKQPLSIPFILVKILGFVGDFLGNKAPINTLKIKKITSNLTFDDSKARNLFKFKPESVLDYFKKNEI